MLLAAVLALLGAGAVAVRIELSKPAPDVRPAFLKHHGEVAAMCPWRAPEADMHAFFPGATAYQTQFVVFSHDRLRILRLLGPDAALMNTSLYVHQIMAGSHLLGAILVQRVAGPHGALEVVVGIKPNGHVAGAHVQRLREPDRAASVITSARWLGGFRDKSAQAPMQVGVDLPSVPPDALPAARTVAQAVRVLVVEYDFALLRKS